MLRFKGFGVPRYHSFSHGRKCKRFIAHGRKCKRFNGFWCASLRVVRNRTVPILRDNPGTLHLEVFQMRLENFQMRLENFQIVWKSSRSSGSLRLLSSNGLLFEKVSTDKQYV